MSHQSHSEGLKLARLFMVLSSIAPLFVLWAIRGTKLIPDRWFIGACVVIVFVPFLFLWLRVKTAIRLQEKRELVIGSAEDHRSHLLVYLFAMLMPFYPLELGKWRDFAATLAALALIVFMFWHLNLHYMNLFFALRGYRVFTVYAPTDGNALTGRVGHVLVTRRIALTPGEHVIAYRLSDTVSFEADR
jgi:hypothetical protein